MIRAVEPLDNVELLESRRGVSGVTITNGPAKLCRALGIDRRFDGHDLHTAPMRLIYELLRPDESIVTSPRIGISKARDIHRRFYIKDNPYVSQ